MPRPTEVHGCQVGARPNVEIEHEISHLRREPGDAVDAGTRQAGVGRGVDAGREAAGRCGEHEHATEIEVVDHDPCGVGVDHAAVDPAGLGIAAPVAADAGEGPHVGHRDAERADRNLLAVGERDLLAAPLGQGQRSGRLEIAAHRALEPADFRGDRLAREVEEHRPGRVACGHREPGTAERVSGHEIQCRQRQDRRSNLVRPRQHAADRSGQLWYRARVD